MFRRLAGLIGVASLLLMGCGGGSESTVSVQTITFGSTAAPSPSPVATNAAPSPTSQGADVVDATAARALVDAWDAARARAEQSLDASGLAAAESSPALDADRVQLALVRAGAARRSAAATVDTVSVAVPHQSAYPAVVYASQHLKRGAASAIEVLGFVRQSAGAGWTLSWHATTPDTTTPVPDLKLGADGYSAGNLDATGQRSLLADSASLANRLAASLRPGAAADRALVLDQGMPDIAATARQTIASFNRSGDLASVTFTGAPTPVAIETADGGAICLVTITYTATLTAAPGHPLVETSSSHPYSQGLLNPGRYAQIVDTYAFTLAAAVPASTGGATIFMFAIGGGLVGAMGTPAPPTPSP